MVAIYDNFYRNQNKFNDVLLIKDYITGVLVSALCKNRKS